MALTFGTAIADRSLQWVGVKGVFAGGAISLVFGFIFGLLVGTTDHPWGFGSWPTDEMVGRYVVTVARSWSHRSEIVAQAPTLQESERTA